MPFGHCSTAAFGVKENMTINLDSSARLLHEAIQQMGWSTDPTLLINRVKRLDLGLPAEDEFIFIISWLGKCSLAHKLDQSQFPPNLQKIVTATIFSIIPKRRC